MSLNTVCRLCLEMDVPVHNIVDSPLQGVYEKLTDISLNTSPRPAMACYLCYSQLKKSHNLMVRSVSADEVLTQILQDGRLVNIEMITMKIRQVKQVNKLSTTPVEIVDFPGPEHKLNNDYVKDEPLSLQCAEEIDTDMRRCIDYLKFEDSQYEEDIDIKVLGSAASIENDGVTERIGDAVGIKSDKLIVPENIKQEKLEETETDKPCCLKFDDSDGDEHNEINDSSQFIEDRRQEEPLSHCEELKQDTESREATGAAPAPAEECKETHVGKIQDGRALASDGKNVPEKRTIRRTVTQEDANKRSSSYTLRSTKTSANITQGVMNTTKYSDDVIKQNYVLNNKLILHTGKKQFKCGTCKVTFAKKDSLEIHSLTHTGEKLFECDMCKRRFNKKGLLKQHLKIHTVEKSFDCRICKVKFRLKVHSMSHTAQQPLECEMCKIKFSLKHHLKRYSNTLTDQKPFECEICKVRFAQKSSLKTHIMRHTGEKPFECEICKVRFTQKAHLKRHSLTQHTGQKPFKCNICKVKFSVKSSLKTHLMTHTS